MYIFITAFRTRETVRFLFIYFIFFFVNRRTNTTQFISSFFFFFKFKQTKLKETKKPS